MRIFLHLTLIILLTILTQVGGLVYLISLFIINRSFNSYRIRRIIAFSLIYLFTTFLIVPKIAPYFGRVKINDNNTLESHSFITKLCNRNYVTSEMNQVLIDISKKFNQEFTNIKVIYLDANFPFINKFPLLPHLSHNDGKKIDLSFLYKNQEGKISNLKLSKSGYGVYENPSTKEMNQIEICKKRGFWQYDFTEYLSFGKINEKLKFAEKPTKRLIEIIVSENKVSKLFIEPHLKNRMNLKNQKIRYHGCQAVRHDDHIHFQIK